MNHALKHIFFTILITSVLYSQVGVLMYEVYCHCKKEFSYHLHIPVSDCSIAQEMTSLGATCCSQVGKCSSNKQDNKPCKEKEIKLLKLEAAKTAAESSFDIEEFQHSQTKAVCKVTHNSLVFATQRIANAPPDSYLPESIFRRNTIPFTQSFLC